MEKNQISVADKKRQRKLKRRLIILNNLCIEFSEMIERHYNIPDKRELFDVVLKLNKACDKYITDVNL